MALELDESARWLYEAESRVTGRSWHVQPVRLFSVRLH